MKILTEMNTTTENNKLIAEFDGHKINWGFKRDCVLFLNTVIGEDKLLYHKSWDWLMGVIRKIEQLPDAYDTEEFLLIRDELPTGRIETTYDAVVDFIKWHNEQNKKL